MAPLPGIVPFLGEFSAGVSLRGGEIVWAVPSRTQPPARAEDWHMAIQEAVAAVENELEEQGRVVLRASGTEPVIRVMVEGKNKEQIVTLAKRLASVVAESAT